MITRCDLKTATVSTAHSNSWSVPYGALQYVRDI
jgi:hypothetical protein